MRATLEDCDAISYEVKMLYVLLHHLHELPTEGVRADWEVVYANALVESHLIHTRVLSEFLLETAAQPDDIVISDFLHGEWAPQGDETERLRRRLPEIHKRLAHLTRRRHVEFPGWPSLLITGDVMCVVSQFLVRVSTDAPELVTGLKGATLARDYFNADYGVQYREITPGDSQ